MERDLLPTMDVGSFYGIAKSLDLGQRKYVRTDEVADGVAEAVRENHFLVKYDKTTDDRCRRAAQHRIQG